MAISVDDFLRLNPNLDAGSALSRYQQANSEGSTWSRYRAYDPEEMKAFKQYREKEYADQSLANRLAAERDARMRASEFQDYSQRRGLDAGYAAADKVAQYKHDLEMQKLKTNPMMDFLSTYRMQKQQPVVGDLSSLLNQYKDIFNGQGAQGGMQRNWQTIASILGR